MCDSGGRDQMFQVKYGSCAAFLTVRQPRTGYRVSLQSSLCWKRPRSHPPFSFGPFHSASVDSLSHPPPLCFSVSPCCLIFHLSPPPHPFSCIFIILPPLPFAVHPFKFALICPCLDILGLCLSIYLSMYAQSIAELHSCARERLYRYMCGW